ncbi:MAG: leucine-rich repeat domain-containing protein [Candidatus Heimdallarchaeota archaeon]|nr:leucine-rich repeat domain-containing protein [Candidatus Heimdallarchaeota archaeon]
MDWDHIIIIPDTLGNLTNLTEINLDQNKIRSIPIALNKLVHLSYFNLHGNQIKEIDPKLDLSITSQSNRWSGLVLRGNSFNQLLDSLD